MSGESILAVYAAILTQGTLPLSLDWFAVRPVIVKMGRTQMKYPPCLINPMTEKPYTRHQWIIPDGMKVKVKIGSEGPVTLYRVLCKRCGLNDPNPISH
jgi:hypothetical protein